jgi:acyl phosphate:glycerol-3-phosphate acyltransferase
MSAASLPRLGATVAAAYLLGTLPSADVAARLATHGAVDLRAEGSGNPGGTNVAKLVGKKWGTAVMLADIAKGALACTVGRRLAGPLGANVAGPAAVVGHCYPVWSGGRGGKGVATSVGQVLATFPAYFPLDFAVAAATVANPKLKHRTFTANTVASVTWVLSSVLWWRRRWPNLWGPPPTVALPLAAAVSSAVIFDRFRRAAR